MEREQWPSIQGHSLSRHQWPAWAKGQIWNWKPLDGMDLAVGDPSMWLGAAKFAAARAAGKPEAVAHQEAERAAYTAHFGITYASLGNIIMPKITTKNKSP